MRKKKKEWLDKERLIAFIETQIDKDAKIQHNVQLPDLTESSRTRQCDVVITTGTKPRETVTIVEVQDRTDPLDITTFDGFLAKMKKVGAQHLICVSNKEFPKSIINEASKSGNTVRLIKFENDIEFGNYKVPQFFDNSIQINDRQIHSVSNAKIGFKKGEMPSNEYNTTLTSGSKIFIVDGEKRDLNKLALWYIDLLNIDLKEGITTIDLDYAKTEKKVYFYVNQLDKKFEIKLSMKIEIYNKVEKIPIYYNSYKQYNVENPLAIILEAKGMYKEDEVLFQFVLTPIDDYKYKMIPYKVPEVFNNWNINITLLYY